MLRRIFAPKPSTQLKHTYVRAKFDRSVVYETETVKKEELVKESVEVKVEQPVKSVKPKKKVDEEINEVK